MLPTLTRYSSQPCMQYHNKATFFIHSPHGHIITRHRIFAHPSFRHTQARRRVSLPHLLECTSLALPPNPPQAPPLKPSSHKPRCKPRYKGAQHHSHNEVSVDLVCFVQQSIVALETPLHRSVMPELPHHKWPGKVVGHGVRRVEGACLRDAELIASRAVADGFEVGHVGCCSGRPERAVVGGCEGK